MKIRVVNLVVKSQEIFQNRSLLGYNNPKELCTPLQLLVHIGTSGLHQNRVYTVGQK